MEMTIGKIIILYREYKQNFDLEENMKYRKIGYSDLVDLIPHKENIVAF